LIEGGGARDLPGVYCNCIRGWFDLKPIFYKTKRRSIYGVKFKEINHFYM
jgi:ribosomal protein S12